MKKLLILSSSLWLVCMLLSCASTPETADTGSGADELIADGSGLPIDSNPSLPESVDGQNQGENQEEGTPAPQENSDSISDLENQRVDEFFGDSYLPVENLSSAEYRSYVNSRFSYRAAIPVSWYINEAVINSSGVTEITRNSAEIRVETVKPSRGDRNFYRRKAISDIEKKDAAYRTIISRREIQMYAGIYADLMVHEYTKKRVSYLRRTIVLTAGDNAHIIVCEAPTSRFYSTEDAFNTFVRSFQPGSY